MLTIKRLNNFKRKHPGAVVALGAFDGLHRGHREIIKRLAVEAHRRRHHSVMLTFEPHPRKVLGRQGNPFILTTLSEKRMLLGEMGVNVMAVVRFSLKVSRLSPESFVDRILARKLGAAVVLCGADCGFGAGRKGNLRLLEKMGKKYGFDVVSVNTKCEKNNKISSTTIRSLIRAGRFGQAIKFLGHPYCIQGMVVKGRRVGRELGYPTANLRISDGSKLLPNDGVYAARALVGGKHYEGMLYIGRRPTFGGRGARSVEFSAFGRPGTLYGHELTLLVDKFIRTDKSFKSPEDLRKAIARDEMNLKRYYSAKKNIHNITG
jgi:riboflavin kinase/FMN adenylyltransferase